MKTIKTYSIWVTVLTLVVLLGMRSPFSPPMPPSNTDIITDTSWIMLSAISNPQFYDSSSSAWTTDLFAELADCEEDELMHFYANDSLVLTEGEDDCSDTLDLSGSYHWFFDANEDTIIFQLLDSNILIAALNKLSDDTLRISYEMSRDTTVHTHTITYVPKNY